MYNVLQLIEERGRKGFDKKLFVSDQYICSLTEIERTRYFASTFVHIFYWRNNCWRKSYIVFRKRTLLYWRQAITFVVNVKDKLPV